MGLAASTDGSCGNHDASGPGRHFTRSSELTTRVYDAVRDEAVALRLAVIRMEHRRHQLEDLFRDEVVSPGVTT